MNSYKIFFDEFQILLNSTDFEIPAGKKMILHADSPEDIEPLVFLIKNHFIKGDIAVFCADPKATFKYFSKKFLYIKAAGGIVKNFKNDILFIYKQNHWDLPKGKVDKGEKKRAAAIREISEECGLQELEITRKISNTYHIAKLRGRFVIKKTYWYEMTAMDHQNLKPDTDEGITDLKWIDPLKETWIVNALYRNLKELLESYYQSKEMSLDYEQTT
jgi:8-oxo-dGTP pyrophosphatase MutT (NUDIX family)